MTVEMWIRTVGIEVDAAAEDEVVELLVAAVAVAVERADVEIIVDVARVASAVAVAVAVAPAGVDATVETPERITANDLSSKRHLLLGIHRAYT